MKKSILLVAMSALFLASCGGAKPTNSTPADGTSVASVDEEVTISKQFVAHYDEMKGFGFDYYAILNLYSNGTLQLSGYQSLSKDTSDYQTNKGFSYDWGNGAWKMDKDEEGDDALVMSVKFGADAYNVMADENLVGTNKYYAYPKADGSCQFTINLPIISGRTATMVNTGAVVYADYNAFIQANKYVFTAPTNSVAELTDAANGYKIYLTDDNKAVYVSGGKDGGVYSDYKNGTWAYADSKLSLTFDGATTEATIEGTTATWTDVWDGWGYANPVNLTLVGDVSAIINAAAAEPTAVATLTAAGDSGAVFTLFDDHTSTLAVTMGGHDLVDKTTWSWANYTLTVMKGEEKLVEATPDGTTYQLAFTYHYAVTAAYAFDYEFTMGPSVYMSLK